MTFPVKDVWKAGHQKLSQSNTDQNFYQKDKTQ